MKKVASSHERRPETREVPGRRRGALAVDSDSVHTKPHNVKRDRTDSGNYVERILLQRSLLAYLPPDLGLRKTGKKRFRGKCPFTRGDANAFEVYWCKDGYWKFNCFSCGEYGNVINFVAKHEKLSLREAIVRLVAGTDVISEEAVMQRAYDRMIESRGVAVLACDAPGCMSEPLELESDLDVAFALAEAGHAGNWFVAPDGIGSLCPVHA